MASVITIAGEKLFAAKAQANEQLDIDTFIFANVPAQDATAPINREEGLPTDHVVHQQIVQQVGRINDNVVVYSTVLDSITGPFEFNWVGLYSSINNTLVAINHIPTTPKTKTEAGVAGNTLNRNFGIEYSGIADLTGIDVAPETWQLDFTARLQGMDKLTQQLAKDLNGADSFIDDGFKVVPRSTLNSFEVTPGVGYINGMRAELEEVVYLNVSEYPKYVYADAYFEGDASSTWAPHVITYLSTDPDKQDFIDGSGVQHYMAPLAIIKGGGEVEDLRASFTESIDTTTKNFKTIESYKAYKQELPIGKVVYIEQRQANFKVELGTELDNDKDIIASNFTGQSIHLIINNNTHVNHLGADANGESDSYPHMYRLWELMVGGKTKVFNTFGGHTYLINSPPRDSAARNIPCYFSSEGVDQLELKNGESIFKVNQIEDSGHAVLFESKGTDGLTFDNIILVGDKTRAEAGDTITALIVSYKESGSKNTTGNSVRVKNGQGVKHDGNSEDYSINWFDSTLRPEGAKIDTIKVDNSEMDFESGEPKGYAFTGAFGGDGARVKTLDVNNIHRAVFFYGAKDVKVEGGTVKNSDSTTVLLGNYGSVLDIDIKELIISNKPQNHD